MNDHPGAVLGESARIFIGGLSNEDDRRRATSYASMPSDEFQARYGHAVDETDKKLDAFARKIDDFRAEVCALLAPPRGGIVVRYATAFEDSALVKLLTAAVLAAAAALGKKASE